MATTRFVVQVTFTLMATFGFVLLGLGESLSSDMTCPKEGFYRDKDDCSRFYRCIENPFVHPDGVLLEKYDYQCPHGLLFDDKLLICNYPDRIKVKEGECKVVNPKNYCSQQHSHLPYFHHFLHHGVRIVYPPPVVQYSPYHYPTLIPPHLVY